MCEADAGEGERPRAASLARVMTDDKLSPAERARLMRESGFEDAPVALSLIRPRPDARRKDALIKCARAYMAQTACRHIVYAGDDGDIWIMAQTARGALPIDIPLSNWLGGVLEAILYAYERLSGDAARAIALRMPGTGVDFVNARALLLACAERYAGNMGVTVRVLTIEDARREASAPAKHSSSQTIMRFILRYIDENIDGDVTLLKLSSLTGYNADYLSGIFSQSMRLTFHTYLNQKKMERIRALMADPTLSIEAVAQTLGFKTRSYFNRFVKRECGAAPKQLRASILQSKRLK